MDQAENIYDVTVIGAGPAGIAAAISAYENGAKTLLVEREARLGGILKQCIHEGFGLMLLKKRLTGPEYAQYFIDLLKKTKVEISLLTFVTHMEKTDDGMYHITLVTSQGIKHIFSKAIVLATGCRERTSKQIFIHGTRPSGILSAGTAQYYTNVLGEMPTKRCVILGSGDIGLIMARRLTLEGAVVVGVYEAKAELGGLMRNYSQCLLDYNIPLHTMKTVIKVYGEKRLEAVQICSVDENLCVIEGTEQIVECDALILSVGLIPENELAQTLDISLDYDTKGPMADQCYQSLKDGIFICGNAYHVNDLVDYVSLGAQTAGKFAALYDINTPKRSLIKITKQEEFAYNVPQYIDISMVEEKIPIYFRSKKRMNNVKVIVSLDNEIIASKKFIELRPAELEQIEVDFSKVDEHSKDISLKMEKVE